jgi:NADP-reducing hydrogenase subunit HndC
LQGRGGAGFPAGRKWKFVRAAKGEKNIVCNADESEPGTFKDRIVLEGDPHVIIEAMAIAGYAVGADEGYIYIRGEYGLAYRRLEKAIEQAKEFGFLGKNIFGTRTSTFNIHLHAGAGAYVCGEETALIESLEGKRGEPRSRPPYPVTNGLWNKPTLVNNVETLANIPAIFAMAQSGIAPFGTPSSPGTKVYTIMGNVNFSGVIEVPMGITLREVINIYAKGMKPGSVLKLAQTGGSSGSIIPAALQDTPMDFESFRKAGVSLGSGALLICDQNTCIVDLSKCFCNSSALNLAANAHPAALARNAPMRSWIASHKGQGKLEELDTLLENLAGEMERASNCGLGQTATVPIRDMLKHFRTEVEAHIRLGSARQAYVKWQEIKK